MPFVLIRDFNFAGDNQFGVFEDKEQMYRFGDNDYYPELDLKRDWPEAEFLSWHHVGNRLVQSKS